RRPAPRTPIGPPSNQLHDARAALPAADAEPREAERDRPARHLVQERQDEPRAARADRMADRDGAAVDVRPVGIEVPDGGGEAELLARERGGAHRIDAG